MVGGLSIVWCVVLIAFVRLGVWCYVVLPGVVSCVGVWVGSSLVLVFSLVSGLGRVWHVVSGLVYFRLFFIAGCGLVCFVGLVTVWFCCFVDLFAFGLAGISF